MAVLEIELTNFINDLQSIADKEGNYLSGMFSFYSFKEDQFDSIYKLTQDYFGDRKSFNVERLETLWEFDTDRGRNIKLKLYENSIEIYSIIGDNINSLTDFDSLGQDFTKPEKAEYLQKKKERDKERLHKLNLDNNELTDEELLKLQSLKEKRVESELYFEKKRKKRLDNELSSLKSKQKDELKRIQELEKQLEQEKQKLMEAEKLERIKRDKADKERKLNKLREQRLEKEKRFLKNKAKNTLPEGYDYNTKFYENKLTHLRVKYGQDSEIDQSMKRWSEKSILNKKDHRHMYAKRYVELYKVKYEGKSIMKNFDNPEITNKSVSDVDSNDSLENFYLFLFLLAVLAVFYGFGCLIAPDCP